MQWLRRFLNQAPMNSAWVRKLDQLGFFKYADDPRAAKAAFDSNIWHGIYGDTGRLFHADAENLAEGDVGRFLREIEPFLNHHGIIINQIDEQCSDSYVVTVNGHQYVMYDSAELDFERSKLGLIWGLSTARSFALVNELMTNAHVEERLYAVNGGNDLFGFFLTPELRDAICSIPTFRPEDRPYIPVEEHPWFGQEHNSA